MRESFAFNLSLRNLIYRLRKFRDILEEELEEIMMEHEEIILDMVRWQQLYEKGINGKGVPIMSYAPYAPRTIHVKQLDGAPYDRVTLHDTGEFYRKMRLEPEERGFEIFSTDSKTLDILDKYGDFIFKLTDSNLKILLHEFIRPELTRRLKARLAED